MNNHIVMNIFFALYFFIFFKYLQTTTGIRRKLLYSAPALSLSSGTQEGTRSNGG